MGPIRLTEPMNERPERQEIPAQKSLGFKTVQLDQTESNQIKPIGPIRLIRLIGPIRPNPTKSNLIQPYTMPEASVLSSPSD